MSEKYNEIVVLVHPLYNLVNGSYVKEGFYKVSRDKIADSYTKYGTMQDRREFDYQLKQSLQAYGEEVIKHSKNPKTFFILYIPSVIRTSGSVKEQKIINEFLGRFTTFCKTKFAGRCIITNSKTFKIDLPNRLVKNLERDVLVKLFGEYGNHCVKGVELALVKSLNDLNLILKIKSKIISEKSLYSIYRSELKDGKLNMRVKSLINAGYSGLKAYREDKRENGKLPIKPRKSMAK